MTEQPEAVADRYAEARRARLIVQAARRVMDRRDLDQLTTRTSPGPYSLEELTGFVVVNARPARWSRTTWAVWCAYVALTGRRPGEVRR